MKDNTGSVRAAAGRRGAACTKHGCLRGAVRGWRGCCSGGRGAVVSSAAMVRADRPRPASCRVSRRGALGPAGRGWTCSSLTTTSH